MPVNTGLKGNRVKTKNTVCIRIAILNIPYRHDIFVDFVVLKNNDGSQGRMRTREARGILGIQ